MFCTEVADVFPAPTSGGPDFVSCILSIIFIATTEAFIPEHMVPAYLLQVVCRKIIFPFLTPW
jgi:hypothetical protein